MPRIWLPAFMMLLTRLSVLIAVVLVVVAFLGVYSITQSAQFALLASVLILVLFLSVLIIVLRRKPSTYTD